MQEANYSEKRYGYELKPAVKCSCGDGIAVQIEVNKKSSGSKSLIIIIVFLPLIIFAAIVIQALLRSLS
ncbi:hypothetical protein [Cohnella mopanensis]|uniref:hypothetical protein n=1 Tax=Cohnella mopanensis TaxID=2911966 RepID=UPI001EF822AE|nr:hypothetical protein [Cohnella mopanensis]